MIDNAIFLINAGCISLLAFAWWKVDTSSFRKIYWYALVLKLAAGLLLGYVYSNAYNDSDTVQFFQSSVELSNLAREDFSAYVNYMWSESNAPYSGENRTLFFVKIVSLFSLITGNNYWIVSLYFSLISFFSAWWFVRTVSNCMSKITAPTVLAVLIFPSSVFWSSGVIKETMAMVSLYFIGGIFIRAWSGKRFTYTWLLTLPALWILWNLKYYYAAMFLPVAATAFLTRWFIQHKMNTASRSAYREFALFTVLLMVMFFIVTFVHPNFYPQRILKVIVENHFVFLEASHPDKVIHFINLEPALGNILMNMPWAVLSGLFRPFIWEAGNVFQVLVSLENSVLALLIYLSLRNFKEIALSEHRLLIYSVTVNCILLCAFLALSTPNFGTLVRYKIGFIPFFVALVCSGSTISNLLTRLFKRISLAL